MDEKFTKHDYEGVRGGVGLGAIDSARGRAQNPGFPQIGEGAKRLEPNSLVQELRNRLFKTNMQIDANESERIRFFATREELMTAIVALEPTTPFAPSPSRTVSRGETSLDSKTTGENSSPGYANDQGKAEQRDYMNLWVDADDFSFDGKHGHFVEAKYSDGVVFAACERPDGMWSYPARGLPITHYRVNARNLNEEYLKDCAAYNVQPAADLLSRSRQQKEPANAEESGDSLGGFVEVAGADLADEDDGCPVDDPDCEGGDGDCHDACMRPAPKANQALKDFVAKGLRVLNGEPEREAAGTDAGEGASQVSSEQSLPSPNEPMGKTMAEVER